MDGRESPTEKWPERVREEWAQREKGEGGREGERRAGGRPAGEEREGREGRRARFEHLLTSISRI